MNDIAAYFDIIHDVLPYHKISARWVWQLTLELKRSIGSCHELLRRFEAKSNVSYQEVLLAMKSRFTITSWKLRERARNGMVPSIFAETVEVSHAVMCKKVDKSSFGTNEALF